MPATLPMICLILPLMSSEFIAFLLVSNSIRCQSPLELGFSPVRRGPPGIRYKRRTAEKWMESWTNLQRSSRQDIRLARLRREDLLGEILSLVRTPVAGGNSSMSRLCRFVVRSVLVLVLPLS